MGGEEKCTHCGWGPLEHQDEHSGLCCDCFDLSFGQPLDSNNEDRIREGKPAIDKVWPGLDENGNRVEIVNIRLL